MKKDKVFFHPINGSGPLTISWSSVPKGDALEAKKGNGIGFFFEKVDLLCVIFDDVKSANDGQILEFDRDCVELIIKSGHITYTVSKCRAAAQVLGKDACLENNRLNKST